MKLSLSDLQHLANSLRFTWQHSSQMQAAERVEIEALTLKIESEMRFQERLARKG